MIGSVALKKAAYGIGLDFEPGSKYEYSNTNFFILGELVSAVSPQHGFMPFTKERVLAPTGPVTVGTNGAYSFTFSLRTFVRKQDTDGRLYTVKVSTADNAGNTGSATTTVVAAHFKPPPPPPCGRHCV